MISDPLRYPLLLMICFTSLLTGCAAPEYRITLNGYLDDQGRGDFRAGARFHVLEGEKDVNPLLHKKIGERIRSLLEEAGYGTAPLEEADYLIRFRIGSTMGMRLITEFEPDHWGRPPYYGWYYGYSPYQGWSRGGRVITYSRFDYNHLLILHVFDAAPYRKDETVEMLWVGEAASLSPTPDLRTATAYLLRALFDYWAEDTVKAVELRIREDDPRVELLR